jgi:DNA-binding PadR family transcriptional regulator
MGRPPHRSMLRLLVLRLLLEKDMHGYEMMKKLMELSEGTWKPAPSTLYPLLDTLKEEGLIEAVAVEHGVRSGSRIKYRLTQKGLKELAERSLKAVRGMHKALLYILEGSLEACRRLGDEKCIEEALETIRNYFELVRETESKYRQQ